MIKESLLLRALQFKKFKRDSSKDYNKAEIQFQSYTKKAGNYDLQVGFSKGSPWVEFYVNDSFVSSIDSLESLLEDLAHYDIPATYIRNFLMEKLEYQELNGFIVTEVSTVRSQDTNSDVLLKLDNGQEVLILVHVK